MSIKPLIWYCRPVANGIWAQETDSAFGAYTPCAIESVDFISYLVLFGLCLYRIWLIKMDRTVKRFCLSANCYNYILIFLGCLCAAEPLARLAMGISIFNLNSQTGLAPFEIVSLGCQILAWSSIIIMIGMETRMYIKEFRWYIRFGVIYVLVGEAVILNLIISMMEFYARSVFYMYLSSLLCQVLFGALLLFHVPHLDPYPGYIPLGSQSDENQYEAVVEGDHICPERHTNIFSRIYFGWMTPLMKLGYKKPISEKDVWMLDIWDQTETLSRKFLMCWMEESQRSKPWLLRALNNSLGGRFWFGGLFKVASDLCQFVGPVLLNQLLQSLQQGDPAWIGYLYAFFIFLGVSLGVVCEAQYSQNCMRVGFRLRSTLVAAVYRKSVRLTHEGRKQFPSGKITNMITTDANGLQQICQQLHVLWSAPFRITIAIVLLYQQLGVASLLGALVLVLMLPIQTSIISNMRKLSKEGLLCTDKRVGLTNEILAAIDAVKCYAWEKTFQSKIQSTRNYELSWFKKAQVLSACNDFILNSIPVLVTVISFGMFTLLGGDLTPARAFTSLSLFAVLQFPLNMLPNIITQAVNANVSVQRLEELFLAEERILLPNPPLQPRVPAISIKDGYFSWDSKNLFVEGNLSESDDGSDYCDLESEPSECGFSESIVPKQSTGVLEKDLILAHLLRLACAPKGALSDAMPGIISELCNLGFVSEQVRDLANKPSSVFNKTFSRAFQQNIVSSKIPQFWKASSDLDVQNPLSSPSSRYLNDFEELQPLGHGGFGHVVLCKNKLDGRQYAVKKIRLKDKNPPLNDHILREVATLSRLQHQHVVRYYQAWFETGISGSSDAMWGSRTFLSSSFSCKDASSSDAFGNENKLESTYLYIQMEYCPRTLRQKFESYSHFDKDLAWHLFRQIVEGLAHIHGQGIIHRDLTPNNIFFGARNDIKIGDFGLAKFLKLEQLDQDLDAAETIGISVDGTGQVGTFFYTAPEIEQGWPKINEKADMYSLGVVFFELWHPFSTAMERHVILSDLIQKGELPPTWVAEFPEQESLLRRMMSSSPSDRPSATELLQHAFPPRMEYDLLDDMLRTIHTSDDTVIYDKIVSAVFNEEILNTKDHTENGGRLKISGNDISSILFSDLETDNRDHVVEVAKEVFRRHCAKHLEIIHMRMLGDCLQSNRNTVKLLTRGGDMIELCHELRLPFVKWVIANQKSFFKRYEISYVYRRPIGHSPPNRYLQGDFDIVGGATALTEAEIIKVSMDIITHFFRSELCDIHLNHGDLLEAIWTWIGIKPEHRKKVAELISVLGSLRPQSSERKRKWVETRRQLRQELNLAETVLNRLQTVGLRFCVVADQALPRLRGALPADKSTHKALDEMSELFNYLRVWKLDKHVYVDALMPPTESYHRNLFFQIYLRANNSPSMEGTLLAIGGRYDYLFHNIGDTEYKPNTPGAVGTSLALETILQHVSLDLQRCRNDLGTTVLVCSRGGGGLLVERMELVAELWEENIKAEFVPLRDPSLTEQYEYANEHDIKCLVIITDTGVAQQGSVKVRHLELRKEKEIEKENLVRFLSEAMAAQFRNPSIWS